MLTILVGFVALVVGAVAGALIGRRNKNSVNLVVAEAKALLEKIEAKVKELKP